MGKQRLLKLRNWGILLIQELDALDFVGEMSQATGVNVVIGVNTYTEETDAFSEYVTIIDQSALSSEDESKLEEYSGKMGFKVSSRGIIGVDF